MLRHDDVRELAQVGHIAVREDVVAAVLVVDAVFFIENVQRERADLLRFNAADHIRNIHQLAAGAVDDGDAVLHFGNGLGVHKVAGAL